MFEYTLEIDRWEIERLMERLDGEAARRYRARLMRSERKKQLLTGLAAIGSHVLQSLGSALVSAGEWLRGGRTSGRAAAA